MRSFFLLCSALCLAGSSIASASVDSGLLSMVPAGSDLVASIDVTRARGSEFGQYLLSKAPLEDAHFRELLDQTGFDPRRDLQTIVVAASGPSQHRSFAILARGNFNVGRIQSLAVTRGAVVQTFEGVPMVINSSKGHREAFAFPDVGVAVMAEPAVLRRIISNRSTPTVLNSSLQSRVATAGSANDIWYASIAGGDALSGLLSPMTPDGLSGTAKTLDSLKESSGGLRLGASIDGTFDALTRSPEDAKSFADVFRLLASMVGMRRSDDPRAALLASSLDEMSLKTTGANVHFAVSIPEKNIEQIAELSSRPRKNGGSRVN